LRESLMIYIKRAAGTLSACAGGSCEFFDVLTSKKENTKGRTGAVSGGNRRAFRHSFRRIEAL